MLELNTIDEIVNEYVETIVPAMLRQNYHLRLVKGGPDYPHLAEQSHFAHIINGVFGLTKLVQFLVTEQMFLPRLDNITFRKGLALYTPHDLHKGKDYGKIDKSEFAIPLARLRQEYEALNIPDFVQIDDHLLRHANVHSRSPRHGDALLSDDPDAHFLWLLVRLADTLASAQTPQDSIPSLKNYLTKLAGSAFVDPPVGQYSFYFHQLNDVRGVLTNTVHNAIAQYLRHTLDLYPLLFFARGALYIGPNLQEEAKATNVLPAITDETLAILAASGDVEAIRDGLRPKNFDFEQYVYSFASAEKLLETVYEDTTQAKPDPKIAAKEIDGLAAKRKDLPTNWRDTVEERFEIELSDPKDNALFNEQWFLVRRYLLFVDTLLRDLNPTEDRLVWFLKTFDIPEPVAANLLAEQDVWGRGGIGKYVLIIGYHFLRGADFEDRPAEARPTTDVLTLLHRRILAAIGQIDTQAGRLAAVETLGFRADLTTYLAETVHLSFSPHSVLEDDALSKYVTIKRKGHAKQLCSLCNRYSAAGQELRTGILDDFGRVFSNRVLPALEAPGQNRSWCPICHLEFIFRKLTGMGLPSGAHYKNSRRIFMYVLPTFSFTDLHLRLFKKLLAQFQNVTNLNVRDYGKNDLGIPHYWLTRRTLDPEWIENVQDVMERTTSKITGWGGREFVGERVSMGRTLGQPHYYLIEWAKAAREKDKDEHIATRTEAWAKAIFAATIISGLTSCKVYVTERPYLPVSDSTALNATITLDSPPPAMRGLMSNDSNFVTISLYGYEKDKPSGLETTLDLCAALWTVTANLKPNKDKHIAGRLERLNIDPLAGAFFYKEFGRENEGLSPYPPFDIACQVLLENKGGHVMDLVQRIAEKSLEIALPLSGSGRGKARRYELLFREGVSAMRKAQKAIPEMRQASLSRKLPSSEGVAELKRLAAGTLLKGLERRRQTKRGEIVVIAWGNELNQRVGELIDILVNELYLDRAGGSFARFIRLENSLADGIYYYTDRHLSEKWQAHKARREVNIDETQPMEVSQ